LYCR